MCAVTVRAVVPRHRVLVCLRGATIQGVFPLLFAPLVQLSQDSNILRTFITDGEGMHDVNFVVVNACSFGTESGKEECIAAARAQRHCPPMLKYFCGWILAKR